MAFEQCGLLKGWVMQGQMSYVQIHSIPFLLGQWEGTKVFDPQRPMGAGFSCCPDIGGNAGWHAHADVCASFCTVLPAPQQTKQQNPKGQINSHKNNPPQLSTILGHPGLGEAAASGPVQAQLGSRRARIVVFGDGGSCCGVPSSLEVISSVCLLEHIAVQGSPRSELLFFDVFTEREKRKPAPIPIFFFFTESWLGASH